MPDLTAETIRSYRESAGLSVADAARALAAVSPAPLPGVASIVRTWKRWEAGTAPSRMYAPLLASLLATARPTPASTDARIDLAGDWSAVWQTRVGGTEHADPQIVRVRQDGNDLRWWAATRGRTIDRGGYLWAGEARLWDNEIVMGWYAADDGSVRSKGTVYLRVHPHGQVLRGRWVGLSHDGDVSGIGVLARTKPLAVKTMNELIEQERTRGTDR